MAPTMADIRAHLDPEEVDYAAATELGPEALPLLGELVRSDEPMLAAKAAYLASLIPADERVPVLGTAATSPHAVVRVAAAAGTRNLDEHDAADLADQLLADVDVGVRKQTVHAAAGFASEQMVERLRLVADEDPDEAIRTIAANSLRIGTE